MTAFDIEIEKNILKGFAHAIGVPLLLALGLFAIDGAYALLGPLAYLLFASTVYAHKVGEAGAWFFSFLVIWPVLFITYGVLLFTAAFAEV